MTLEIIGNNIFAKNEFIPLSKQKNLYDLQKEKIRFIRKNTLMIKGSGKYRITNSFFKRFESFIDYNIKYTIKLYLKKNKINIKFKNKLYICHCKLSFKKNNIFVKEIIIDTLFFVPSFIQCAAASTG